MEHSMTAARVDFDRAMKPFALPLGLASPMWLAYGAAASVGATWWWMSQMTRFGAKIPGAISFAPAALPVVAKVAEPAAAAVAAPLAAVEEPVLTAPVAVESPISPLIEQPDELTLLRGVGPRVADALVARGVTTFAQLAAWTDAELAAFDTELKLLGRSKRYDFLGQARDLAAG